MLLGLNIIKELTKQSIHTKPFCLAVGKEWTLRQSEFKLEDTYTELHFQMKYRKPTWTEKKPLEDIFTLFEDTTLKRLLIEGIMNCIILLIRKTNIILHFYIEQRSPMVTGHAHGSWGRLYFRYPI